MNSAEPTDVPCKGCTECCRSNQGLVLHPEHGDDVDSYRSRVVGHRPAGDQVLTLATDEAGCCVYLGANGCTIYDRRPFLCRSFDCRKHYLMLPRQDRDNLVQIGLSSRAVFNAGRSRLKTLTAAERKECLELRDEYFP
ncbi:MAG TPA: YkgJ family cysteine cluster protein [Bryobacteraceae bacterium]|nr:YkgJ family cysteine cluster protein [Bryobacteraceae bacterium]